MMAGLSQIYNQGHRAITGINNLDADQRLMAATNFGAGLLLTKMHAKFDTEAFCNQYLKLDL